MEVKGEKSAKPSGSPDLRSRCADCGMAASRVLWILGDPSARYCSRCSDARWDAYLAAREAAAA